MNWDIIKGNWKQMAGQVQSKWGELTDDEVDMLEGDRDRLAGLIQERYGIAKDEAERQIDSFVAEYKSAA
ncbi:hypothetical protein ROLI_032640 [Roseobacter fucihabitans]|uniref:CsbD-like domain-containing protein n=1 Tax=Roseobacter fucihabitans TaxID=1537242 RepID=A0ABZ2BXR8_9RHOB|nr:CsbD family protein [Roseobacter litoralis]MBC6965070.1 hypothetical protein [Roseobacter litoralis]